MFEYKKHIASFFTMLFLVSQFAYVGHFLFHPHHHHFEHKIISVKKSNKATCKIKQEETHSSNDLFNCFICQQHQTVELYKAISFRFEIKNSISNNNEGFNYINPHFFNNLLQYPSLRAPPSVS